MLFASTAYRRRVAWFLFVVAALAALWIVLIGVFAVLVGSKHKPGTVGLFTAIALGAGALGLIVTLLT